MKAIHQYFNDFYVPNNMAMVLVGDLEFDETILLVDKYFGELKIQRIAKKEQIVEEPLTQIIEKQLKVLLRSVCIWLGEQILTERRKRDWRVWWLKFCLILAKQVCWI
jgi:predicted Zn-dependent peptidase